MGSLERLDTTIYSEGTNLEKVEIDGANLLNWIELEEKEPIFLSMGTIYTHGIIFLSFGGAHQEIAGISIFFLMPHACS